MVYGVLRHFQQYFSYVVLSVSLVEETGIPRENYRPVTSRWQSLSHNDVSSAPRHERVSNSQVILNKDLLYCSKSPSLETCTCTKTLFFSHSTLPVSPTLLQLKHLLHRSYTNTVAIRGGSRGGAPPLKLEKIWFLA